MIYYSRYFNVKEYKKSIKRFKRRLKKEIKAAKKTET